MPNQFAIAGLVLTFSFLAVGEPTGTVPTHKKTPPAQKETKQKLRRETKRSRSVDKTKRCKKQKVKNFANFFNAHALDVDNAGNIYVADTLSNQLVKLNAKGKLDTKWASDVFIPAPRGLKLGRNDDVIVAPNNAKTLTVLSKKGKPKKNPYMSKKESTLFGPYDMDFDRQGRLIVADTGNSQIKIYGKNGKLQQTIGRDKRGRIVTPPSPDDPPDQLSLPHGIGVHGNFIYIADYGNDRIIRCSLKKKKDACAVIVPKLKGVYDVALDKYGDIYASSFDGGVYRYTPRGKLRFKLSAGRKSRHLVVKGCTVFVLEETGLTKLAPP